jgi:1-acyl-sn-glycerol-3-phosphate acyltransferase
MDKKIILISLYLMIYLTIGGFFLLIPFILSNTIMKMNKKIFYSIKNILLSSLSFLIILLYPIKINVNSIELLEKIDSKKNIIISNHYTELDFFFASMILNNPKNFYLNTIFLSKKIIGYLIPSCGLVGIFCNDIYLSRNINLDSHKLDKKLDFDKIFFYPEGTCFNNERKINSDIYCKKNNLPIFKFHLYPRTKGFELILNNNHDISYVYDLTFVYDTINKKKYGNHFHFLSFINKFNFPSNVYVNIARYKIIKKYNKAKLLENIFINKDKFIKNFDHKNNNFVPIKYNFYFGLINFIFINFIFSFSIYLLYYFIIFRYLFLFEIIIYLFYFYFKV